MVKLTKIYTRGGDKGMTSLGDGARVAKHHPRMELLGTIDEANAVIGLARTVLKGAAAKKADLMLARIQNELFDLGADLCVPEGTAKRKSKTALRVTAVQTARLESEIDALNKSLGPLTSFILPGGSMVSSYLHLARTVVRRAERHLVQAMQTENINPETLRYLNRLSDHLFVLARTLNRRGKDDVLWVPGKTR